MDFLRCKYTKLYCWSNQLFPAKIYFWNSRKFMVLKQVKGCMGLYYITSPFLILKIFIRCIKIFLFLLHRITITLNNWAFFQMVLYLISCKNIEFQGREWKHARLQSQAQYPFYHILFIRLVTGPSRTQRKEIESLTDETS